MSSKECSKICFPKNARGLQLIWKLYSSMYPLYALSGSCASFVRACLQRLHCGFGMFSSMREMNEEELLCAHQIGDVIGILQRTTNHLYDPDELLTVAFDKIGSMTTNTITKQRKRQGPAVVAELDQRVRRLNSFKLNEA